MTAGAHQVNAPAVVLTFYPHPSAVLRKRQDSFYLTSPEERAELLGSLGVDYVITHPFNLEVSKLSAHDFMAHLMEHLSLSHLLVGYDFALGRGREGNVLRLRELGEELGYSVTVVPPYKSGDTVISSSQVRAALGEGDADEVRRLLGRPYRISGEVIRGDRRGRTIGIPTANLSIWTQRVIPKTGVYVCQAQVDGRTWGAVTNIGVRPTFHEQPVGPTVEAHLLDFDHDLYGKEIQLDFLSRLRDEQRFSSIQALVDQIHQDIQKARDFLH